MKKIALALLLAIPALSFAQSAKVVETKTVDTKTVVTQEAKPAHDGKHHGKHHGKHQGHRFDKMDTDKDGKISKVEALAKAEAMFAKQDANKDGFVTKEEMKELRAAKRAKHAAHHAAPDQVKSTEVKTTTSTVTK